MCDFFSGVVRIDGAWKHVKENSHSSAVAEAGWRENDNQRTRFAEAEATGEGVYPGAQKICRSALNEKQVKTVDRIYVALYALIDDPSSNAERMLFGRGIFSGEDYADVRWRILIHPKCPSKVARRLCETTLFVSKDQQPQNVLPKWLKKIDGGDLDLSGYSHALPSTFTHCGGDLYLSGYSHALPSTFTRCGGDLYLSGYSHALPSTFTHCGGGLYLSGYSHALPSGFKKNHKP